MSKLKGARLFINGTNIPVIADTIEADPPVDVSNVQMVSTSSGVGTKGYQSLGDSKCEISFSSPMHYEGINVLDLIESVYDPVNGSFIAIVDDQSVWQYRQCFRTDRDKTTFDGERAFAQTFEGAPA